MDSMIGRTLGHYRIESKLGAGGTGRGLSSAGHETATVLDFGLARAFATDESAAVLSGSPTVPAPANREGAIVGTVAYMSPEQARGKTVDRRADIWVLGCVLYEALCRLMPSVKMGAWSFRCSRWTAGFVGSLVSSA